MIPFAEGEAATTSRAEPNEMDIYDGNGWLQHSYFLPSQQSAKKRSLKEREDSVMKEAEVATQIKMLQQMLSKSNSEWSHGVFSAHFCRPVFPVRARNHRCNLIFSTGHLIHDTWR